MEYSRQPLHLNSNAQHVIVVFFHISQNGKNGHGRIPSANSHLSWAMNNVRQLCSVSI